MTRTTDAPLGERNTETWMLTKSAYSGVKAHFCNAALTSVKASGPMPALGTSLQT